MQNLCGSMFVVLGAGGKIGHFIDIVGNGYMSRFASGIMSVQGRDHCHVK
jgi:hypothetical protein